jgi:hypothetical protein
MKDSARIGAALASMPPSHVRETPAQAVLKRGQNAGLTPGKIEGRRFGGVARCQ